MATDEAAPLPEALAEIAADFAELEVSQRLQLLLELSDELPELPPRFADAAASMERVDECQSPLFLAVEVDRTNAALPPQERPVHLFFSAPPEAPTTRGFAGILREGLEGLSVAEVLAVPDDAPLRFSLAEAVSPLRLRGMSGMLSRIKRQVSLQAGVEGAAGTRAD